MKYLCKAQINKIVHTLNCIIQGAYFSEYYVGEIDGINASNTSNRKLFMGNLKEAFPVLFNFFNMLYTGEQQLLFFFEDGRIGIINSSDGTVQGGPEGMFLFSLGEKTPLDNINAKAPADSLAFAYADNVYLLAKKKDF